MKAALEEGILPGGGVALMRAGKDLDIDGWKGDVRAGAQVLQAALRAPFHQIVENAGEHGAVTASKVLKERKKSHGYNAETREFCDLLESGVIDPCKVTTTALTNAVSAASMLISTNCLVADVKDDEAEAGDDME